MCMLLLCCDLVQQLLWIWENCVHITPDSKDHGANIGPTWVLSAPGGPHVGPMNLAIRYCMSKVDHFDIIPRVNQPYTDYFIATGCLNTAIVYAAWWPLLQLLSWYQPILIKSLLHIWRSGNCRFSLWVPWGHLNIIISFYKYTDSHYKSLYIEMRPLSSMSSSDLTYR